MRTKSIRQTVLIPASPAEVYKALMTSRGHSEFTGSAARVSPRVGGTFTAWDGYIEGRNIELVPGKKIVQAWRPAEEGWPADHYSRVTFRLAPARGGTRITFTHTGVVAEHAGHLAAGWKTSYWEPLREYFRTRSR